MSEELKEAFPWQESRPMFKLKESDEVLDANGKIVAIVFGYGAAWADLNPPGVRERRRLILEAPAMFMLLRDLRNCGAADPIRAAKILDRIEGKQET